MALEHDVTTYLADGVGMDVKERGDVLQVEVFHNAQNLTQAELGEKMGVQRAQVCRIESGKSITLASMMRAFRALGVQVALEMKGIGKVAL